MKKIKHLILILFFGVSILQSGFTQHYLKISKNNRFLVTSGESPFFWMGDTGWELFHKLNLDETQHYLRNRAGKGFTVIQTVVLAECDGLTKPTPDGFLPLIDNDPEKPNEEYFTHVDKVIDMAAGYGLYMAVLPTWGSHAENKPSSLFKNMHIFTPTNSYKYGKYLGNRYKDKWNVVWIVGGDRSPEGNENIWKEMIRGIREGCGNKQLISYHINGRRSITEVPEIANLLDFYMMQSGHGNVATPNFKMIEIDYNHKPVKPVIDGEPVYEIIPIGFNPVNGYTSDYEPRRAMYWSVFAGGFGVTYGNNSVWQMNKDGYPPVLFPKSTWEEAIDDPGSFQVRHLADLMLSRPFLTRIPDNSLVDSDNYSEADYKVATRDGTSGKNDATYIMAYFPIVRRLQIDTSSIVGKNITAWLFDPRTGVAYKMGEFKNTGTFNPPWDSRIRKTMGGPDWVIVVDDADKDYPAPGEK